MISLSLDDTLISDSEFSAMVRVYDSAKSKLEKQHEENNYDNIARSTSTNSGQYHPSKNQHDLNNLNQP
jgi:hypothetical protein